MYNLPKTQYTHSNTAIEFKEVIKISFVSHISVVADVHLCLCKAPSPLWTQSYKIVFFPWILIDQAYEIANTKYHK